MTFTTPTPFISSTAMTPSPERGNASPHYVGVPRQLPNALIIPEDMTEPTVRLAMRVRPDKQDFYHRLGASNFVVSPLPTTTLPSQLVIKKDDNMIDHSPFLQGYNYNVTPAGMPDPYASTMEQWYTLRQLENLGKPKRLLKDIARCWDDNNGDDDDDDDNGDNAKSSTDQGRRRKQPRLLKRRRRSIPNQLKG